MTPSEWLTQRERERERERERAHAQNNKEAMPEQLRPSLAQLLAPDSQAESGELWQILQNQEK
jgi:hypothetical protein